MSFVLSTVGGGSPDHKEGTLAAAHSVGVWETFVTLAAIYLVFMVGGALGYRLPPDGWKPARYSMPASALVQLWTPPRM